MELQKRNLFPCGRLDKNTLGLVLLTDDGELAHRLLAPKSHVKKLYRYSSKFPVSPEDAQRFEAGLVLEDGYETKPAEIRLDDDRLGGYITLVEGKYHQIKRMFERAGSEVVFLKRESFAGIPLDIISGVVNVLFVFYAKMWSFRRSRRRNAMIFATLI